MNKNVNNYILFMRFIKIFFVSVSQPARRAANTLPISWERIFMLVIPKIFLVTITQQRDAVPNKLPISRELYFILILD